MSIKVMTEVWTRSYHSGSDLLMLLALADFSDDHGNSYPSVPTLAAKCRMKPRNANYILSNLQTSGELEVRVNEGPKGTNRYRIVLGALGGMQAVAGSGVHHGAGVQPIAGVQSSVATPATQCAETLQPVADEPSLNHQEPSVKRVHTRSTRPRPSETTIADSFGISPSVRAWAERKGFSDLEVHLEAFVDKCLAKGYTAVDWDAKFRTAVRDDWAGLRKGRAAGAMHADDVFGGKVV